MTETKNCLEKHPSSLILQRALPYLKAEPYIDGCMAQLPKIRRASGPGRPLRADNPADRPETTHYVV
jgi:hypothetical protein